MATNDDRNTRKLIASNKKARHDYTILDTYEAGLVLNGTEVKSLRDGRASLIDGYATVSDDEVWLRGVHINEYVQGTWTNHAPRRARKLLLHRAEIDEADGHHARSRVRPDPAVAVLPATARPRSSSAWPAARRPGTSGRTSPSGTPTGRSPGWWAGGPRAWTTDGAARGSAQISPAAASRLRIGGRQRGHGVMGVEPARVGHHPDLRAVQIAACRPGPPSVGRTPSGNAVIPQTATTRRPEGRHQASRACRPVRSSTAVNSSARAVARCTRLLIRDAAVAEVRPVGVRHAGRRIDRMVDDAGGQQRRIEAVAGAGEMRLGGRRPQARG